TVCKRGRSGLVDYSHNFQACDPSGVFRRLSLWVVAIRGHGNNCLSHLLAQTVFRCLSDLFKNNCRASWSRPCLLSCFKAKITTGSPPAITATTELVVPRSMPMILLIS